MRLIEEIEDLIEYFESKSADTQEVAAGSAMDALKKQLENMGGASKTAKKQEPKKVEEPEDSSDEDEADDLPKSGKKIDSNHNPDDDDEDDKDSAPVAAPITVHTKIAKNVKLADTGDIAEYYSKLVKMKDKLEALEKIDDEDRKSVV